MPTRIWITSNSQGFDRYLGISLINHPLGETSSNPRTQEARVDPVGLAAVEVSILVYF